MKKVKIGVIGLGYVGLPLARLFATKYEVIGFDLKRKEGESFLTTTDYEDLMYCNVFIVCVPTPVDCNNKPDLEPLKSATYIVSYLLKRGDTVIYESTVYPGCTEEFCVPLLEYSGLDYNKDFFVGYSPERINPSDKVHTVENITKIVSGYNEKTLKFVSKLYSSVLKNGVYEAQSIKVAEAAKLIENIQRDVNIALMNEFTGIFRAMGIDANQVIDAASTKWNFIPFRAGLVGGHCIGVDPYYLLDKVTKGRTLIGLAREINEAMAEYVAVFVSELILDRNIYNPKILILGFTFKENCEDVRNTKVEDLCYHLGYNSGRVDVYDPIADKEAMKHYNVKLLDKIEKKYDCIVLAVAHDEFLTMDLRSILNPNGVIYDVKGVLKDYDARL
jgi:UDP-N-acetyl-D-glucosamine/UDP-N-acetyl-D-galactosamine dehydrogenase